MPKGEHKSGGDVSADDSVVTIVLLGQNSTDKCLVGNAMLGSQCFQPGKCMYQKALGRVRNELLYIINTPEFFWRPNQDLETNAIEAMKPSYPGTRIFLLVLQDKQLSNEEMEMFTKLKERFGEKIVENVTVVLIDSKQSSEESRDTADTSLKQILHECNERACVFSKDMRGADLVGQLLPEKHDLDRSNVDINKHINQEEKDEPEQPKQEESVNAQLSGGEGMNTVVLLGLNSDDKCLIGNSILQHDCFTPGRTICDRVVARVGGQMVYIVNTPDLFVFKPRPDLIADSMEMKPSYAGPRVFLMVLQDKTLLHEEMEMIADLKEKFGEKLFENMLAVLISSKDENSDKCEVEENLKMFLDECKDKIYVFRSNVKSIELVEQLMGNKKNTGIREELNISVKDI